MKNDYNEFRPEKESRYERLFGLDSIESSTEFTGLTPSLPQDDDDMDSYSDMQDMPYKSDKPYKK